MQKKSKLFSAFSAVIITVLFFVSCSAPQESLPLPEKADAAAITKTDEIIPETDNEPEKIHNATYLGVEGYGFIDRNVVLDPESCIFRFDVDGREVLYKIDCGEIFADGTDPAEAEDYSDVQSLEDGAYPLHNLLKEKYKYDLTVVDNTVTEIVPLSGLSGIEPVIKAVPGEKTLKNFLKTAFEPMGTTLYVYGGGWDYQDVGGSYDSVTIGLSPSWNEFFEQNDADYMMRDEDHPELTTFPYGSWNEYYYAGLDCSGYVGWVLYNTMYDESFAHPSFVKGSSKIAQSLDMEYGFGHIDYKTNDTEAEDTDYSEYFDEFKVGDVVSTGHHVYIVIGKCDDGSFVIINSTNNESNTGKEGGGVQMGALSPKGTDDTSCQAFALADEYTRKYYPEWAERYPMLCKNHAVFLDFPEEKESVGIFHWDFESENGISDPDGYADMTANQILEDIFSGL